MEIALAAGLLLLTVAVVMLMAMVAELASRIPATGDEPHGARSARRTP